MCTDTHTYTHTHSIVYALLNNTCSVESDYFKRDTLCVVIILLHHTSKFTLRGFLFSPQPLGVIFNICDPGRGYIITGFVPAGKCILTCSACKLDFNHAYNWPSFCIFYNEYAVKEVFMQHISTNRERSHSQLILVDRWCMQCSGYHQ